MKPIRISEKTKQELIENFTKYINNVDRITNDNVTYSAKITRDELNAPKAKLYFTTKAYLKMMLYVRDTNSEIAWHGIVERKDNTYLVKDVMLYPQTVTGATVDTDQTEYNNWLEGLDDDTYNHLRFQGHSHVNMATSPSGTDIAMYNNFLQVLPKDDFYIFMILNKQGAATYFIYDLAQNIMYESTDILVGILDTNGKSQVLTEEIMSEVNEQKTTCVKQHVYPAYDYSRTYNYPVTYPNYTSAASKLDEYSETDELYDAIDKKFNTNLKFKNTVLKTFTKKSKRK